MKFLPLLLLASTVLALPARAEIVTYRYTGAIGTLWEYDNASDTITNVQSSSLPGRHFQLGDTLTGTFSYDTNMALSDPRFQPAVPAQGSDNNYDGFVQADLTDAQGGLVYRSDPSWTFLAAGITDSASTYSGHDFVSFWTSGPWSPSRFELVDFFFDDLTGTALNSSAIPAAIDLAAFPYSSVSYGFSASNGDQMHAMAWLTSLERLDTQGVPEPGSLALLGAGMVGLFGVGRRIQWQGQVPPCRGGVRPWSKI